MAEQGRQKDVLELAELRVEVNQLQTNLHTSNMERNEARERNASLQVQADTDRAHAKQWEQRWYVESRRRRDLHNQLQDMVGALRVGCRIRPLTDAEKKAGAEQVVEVEAGETITVQHQHRDTGAQARMRTRSMRGLLALQCAWPCRDQGNQV